MSILRTIFGFTRSNQAYWYAFLVIVYAVIIAVILSAILPSGEKIQLFLREQGLPIESLARGLSALFIIMSICLFGFFEVDTGGVTTEDGVVWKNAPKPWWWMSGFMITTATICALLQIALIPMLLMFGVGTLFLKVTFSAHTKSVRI